MQTELPWVYEAPTKPGIYFVAVKLGPAAGVYDFLLWSGDEWETDQKGKIIAHVAANTLKEVFDIAWPEKTSNTEYRKKTGTENDDDLWTEA